MADTVLVLGEVTFGGREVPTSLPFGGEQRLSVHDLVGGKRIIDAMGRSDRSIEWSGWFLGEGAVDRAQYLDGLRISGASQSLTWDKFRYLVNVRSFTAEYQRFYQIPYRISCEVISDLTQPAAGPGTASIDQTVNSDATAAATLAAATADQQLITAVQGIQSAIATVTLLATAPKSILSGIIQSVSTAQGRVSTLLGLTTAALGVPVAFAGVIPGISAVASAAALTAQTTGALQLTGLQNLQGVLGRMSLNLASVSSSPNSVTVAGGTLFDLAEQQYADADAWTAIAKANGLTDPFLQGTQTLLIPPLPDQSGGVLTP